MSITRRLVEGRAGHVVDVVDDDVVGATEPVTTIYFWTFWLFAPLAVR